MDPLWPPACTGYPGADNNTNYDHRDSHGDLNLIVKRKRSHKIYSTTRISTKHKITFRFCQGVNVNFFFVYHLWGQRSREVLNLPIIPLVGYPHIRPVRWNHWHWRAKMKWVFSWLNRSTQVWSPSFLCSGDFLPTKPLTILTAVIHQQGIVAIDTVQDLLSPLNPPFNQERRLSPPLGAFHVPNYPSRLSRHDQSSLDGLPKSYIITRRKCKTSISGFPDFPRDSVCSLAWSTGRKITSCGTKGSFQHRIVDRVPWSEH